MKMFLIMSLAVLSLEVSAFTTITIKTEAKLVANKDTNTLEVSLDQFKGNDYCYVSLRSTENTEALTLPAGTVFAVTEVTQNACGNDWGRQCRLDLSAYNQEKGVGLSMVCKNRGMFASKLSVSKVNKIVSSKLSVK